MSKENLSPQDSLASSVLPHRPAHQRHLWLPWKQNAETIESAAVAEVHAHTGTHGACENLEICMNTAGDVGGGVETGVTTVVAPGVPLG